MHAGRLRHRVTIQRQPAQPQLDAFKQPIPQPQPLQTISAQIEEQTGTQIWKYKQMYPLITHLVIIRYYPGLLVEDYLTYLDPGTGKTRELNILAVLDFEGRRREHHVICKEKAA